jgi:hypothetical protein
MCRQSKASGSITPSSVGAAPQELVFFGFDAAWRRYGPNRFIPISRGAAAPEIAMNVVSARFRTAALVLVAVFGFVPFALAHKTSYGSLRADFMGDQVSGKLEIAVRDFDVAFFDFAFGPVAGGGALDLEQLRRHEAEIASLLLGKISLGSPGAPCGLHPGPIEIDMPGEPFLILPFSGSCKGLGEPLQVGYDLVFDIDAQHRAIVDVRRDGEVYSGLMSPETRVLQLEAGAKSLHENVVAFVAQGAHHIWIGYDHILFLLSLLLPGVLTRRNKEWLPVDDLAGAFWSTGKIVTAFTLSHSVTLTIAALGMVELPSRMVESTIAASIAVAAINNIYPVITRRLWVVAFVFGLIHGFGFATVLNELGLPPDQKLVALVSFNVGVELGQLTIVAVVLPVLFLVRRTLAYTRLVMPAGSALISAIALIWLFERATDVPLLSG